MCGSVDCSKCGFKGAFNTTQDSDSMYCETVEYRNPDEAVRIVEEWGKTHPQKTYMDDFFEKFPNASKRASKIPTVCRQEVYSGVCSFGVDCYKCWNEAMEE